ncbi:hypothetical protein F383_17355 [Gossypium arboreum]|uniref:Uncharacterized protein n=1 Tax=Gossypium arboreum TaxID=29729 RepID=A0A0B0NWF9_GOSAR|nr:hypothetical protein F383_17355 [Gossypium arboreum]
MVNCYFWIRVLSG